MEIFGAGAEEGFYEQLIIVQEKLLKGDIRLVNTNAGPDYSRLVMCLGDPKDIGGKFTAICSFHRLVIVGSFFEHRA